MTEEQAFQSYLRAAAGPDSTWTRSWCAYESVSFNLHGPSLSFLTAVAETDNLDQALTLLDYMELLTKTDQLEDTV